MRLGIDFGTTRTVVAAVDRGNYPVISFQTASGDALSWYPTLVAAKAGRIVFGLDARICEVEPGWECLKSLKRLLADIAPDAPVQIGDRIVPAFDLLVAHLSALRRDLCQRSNLQMQAGEPLEALIGVPANANSNQRFMTMEGFRRAGFRVLGMINEPSAAGIEFAHHHAANDWAVRREYLVVYDLGGGTFDASIISRRDYHHEVITDAGITQLGGDDFDRLLKELTLARAGVAMAGSESSEYRLLEECRRQKESLHPNTRNIAVDLGCALEGAGTAIVPVDEFYDRCRPLLERTIAAVEAAMSRARETDHVAWSDIAVMYLVGGSSDLPIVGRMLRERYGRRVRRSPYPCSATAIGLAIAADTAAGHTLRERFTRHFGVWRESDSGRRVVFDSVFAKDILLPRPEEPPLIHRRSYMSGHNIGHFRYLECSRLNADGQPDGDITPWDSVVFALDPALRSEPDPSALEVHRIDPAASQSIEETYACDSRGAIEVTMANRTAGYQQTYNLRALSAQKRKTARPRGSR